jgi:hypothetical protein
MKGWQVHHRRYDAATMLGKVPADLVLLCDKCHQREERIENANVGLAARQGKPKVLLGGVEV